jgi:hypothetical protein
MKEFFNQWKNKLVFCLAVLVLNENDNLIIWRWLWSHACCVVVMQLKQLSRFSIGINNLIKLLYHKCLFSICIMYGLTYLNLSTDISFVRLFERTYENSLWQFYKVYFQLIFISFPIYSWWKQLLAYLSLYLSAYFHKLFIQAWPSVTKDRIE